MDKENDLLIWNKIGNGDSASYDALFTKYYEHLYNYGFSLTQDDGLIKDAIQDLFLDLWRHRTKIKIHSSVKFYLLQSFRRILFLRFKENKLVPLEDTKNNELRVESVQKEIIQEESQKMKLLNLKIMAEHLTPRQREAIFLKFYRGMDSEEISDLMDIDIKAVYKLISTGIIRYRKLYKNDGNIG